MITWRQAAKIGVIVHGPEIVDSGSALQLINYLKNFGSVSAVLGGTMGRVAVLDAGLENVIAIDKRSTPSQSIKDSEAVSDILFLLNQSKSQETGQVFGAKVSAAARVSKPLLQIDCGGKFVISLAGEAEYLAKIISLDLGLEVLKQPILAEVLRHKNRIKRTIAGVRPGEPISINGTVVARARDDHIEVEAQDGRIIDIKGADNKLHGLEKLQDVDLEKAIIRSGSIRRTKFRPRFAGTSGIVAVLIDHCAEDALEKADGAYVAVTVGDDTTAIAGDILARLGIPIIGVTDGDLDRLAGDTMIHPGSIIIKVTPGCDDIIGKSIKIEIFKGKIKSSLVADEIFERILKLAGQHIISVERF